MEITNCETSRFVDSLCVLETFYEALPVENYSTVPDNWMIAVTDVVQSRAAISKGQYKAVNMSGVAMITAIMNSLGHQKIPYIFGGDGSAIAFAPDMRDTVSDTLARTKAWVEDSLSLQLRAAIVPVAKIRQEGADVRIAGLKVSNAITNYAFMGGGVALAERLMKEGHFAIGRAGQDAHPDLTGLSCRWMPVQKKGSKIVSMIVESANKDHDISNEIMEQILDLVRAEKTDGHPAREDQIKFKWPVDGVDLEALATGDSKFKLYLIALIAAILNRTGWSVGGFDPNHYRKQLSLNTDYRKIQDGLRMTLSLEHEQVRNLKAFLEKHRDAGVLKYGLFEQDHAVLTCFVPSVTSDDHYHFLDGAGGGYAAAADDLH